MVELLLSNDICKIYLMFFEKFIVLNNTNCKWIILNEYFGGTLHFEPKFIYDKQKKKFPVTNTQNLAIY